MSTSVWSSPCSSRQFPTLRHVDLVKAKHVRMSPSSTTRHRSASVTIPSATAELNESVSGNSPDDAAKVQSAEGVRLRRLENGFQLEYLLHIDEPVVKIWVLADRIAEDVKLEYEASWWQCCRQGDVNKVEAMLKGGGQALVVARDADDRSALHYACGVGSEECVRTILAYGAEVDAEDKDCFTPLHIAAGYLHETIVEILVQSGANPELQDNTGRSPLDLVETLKLNTPTTTVTFARQSVLESIAKTLEQHEFEEMPPGVIKGYRTTDNEQKEYLVEWLDDFSDSWVFARDISDDLIEDFEGGLEYAHVSKTYLPPSHHGIQAKENVANRQSLVKWMDDATPSWEPRWN
mmetsp:Transcript_28899/g.71335  ORF Transcript_28899/g.71335 Transcript_28899/m.71335 type:complete len:350 (+) Transcript_28899:860-1909(+)|eukprot:CAMPEP_0197577162 /NCGR_PEP_ID=MMETSP1326-20131121/1889_1 /TAXON_ID=1155430 /ORGANISM="Genus nov. species nov., Strain RCC2288" /LENGTH=349 /DNA_ID=CAMNT_0043140183 /DNA_START=822 /DNA_END=1874 /DNA_ORIENTATION=+